jgi:hypothetical protein
MKHLPEGGLLLPADASLSRTQWGRLYQSRQTQR